MNMELSMVTQIGKLEIIRDAHFSSLGFLGHPYPNQLAYIECEKYFLQLARVSNVSCVITNAKLAPLLQGKIGLAISDNPRRSFYDIHNHLARNTDFYGKRFENEISKTATIHPKAFVAQKNVIISDGCFIGPNATILENSVLGSGVIIGAGTIIG